MHVRVPGKEYMRFRVDDLPRFPSVMASPSSQPATAACWQQQIDAIELLLEDLGCVDPNLQHRASFQSCWQELSQLRQELVTLLLSRRRLAREATSASRGSSGHGDC